MIVQVLSSSRGGAATHVGSVAEGLREHGHAVAVVMPFDDGNLRVASLESRGVRVIPWRGPLRLARDLAGAQAVHAHGSRAALWAWASLLWARSAVPMVYSIHGFVTPHHPQPRRTLQLWAERLVAARCSAIVADARAERRDALRWGLAAPEKVRTVYLGFDLEPFLRLGPADRARARTELGFAEDRWHLLCVCRLDRPRDFPTLLKAVAGLPDNSELHVVGSGPFREQIEGLAAELGLGPRVRLWGMVPDVVSFYAAADAFVLTSWGWEGCPVTAIEAGAAGLPVVVSDAGGACEAIVPGTSGLLVPRRDEQALADALARVRTSGQGFGEVGRAHVRANFPRERMIAELMRIYRCGIKTT